MDIFSIVDKKTFEESLEKAESLSREGVMDLFKGFDISSFTPGQWMSFLTIGFFLMSQRERDQMCRSRGIKRKNMEMEV